MDWTMIAIEVVVFTIVVIAKAISEEGKND